MTILLQIDNISVKYGKVEAVRDVSLEVPTGAIVTVIGPNGAGKTTLLNAIQGLLPRIGAIRYLGGKLREGDVESAVEAGLCLVPEQRELFGELSVADNLVLGSYARKGMSKSARNAEIEEIYDRFPRLRERHSQAASTLSGGERQMLAIARALMSKPRLLMLDEPSLGLAPLIVREMFELIVGLRKSGVSILLVEQNARAALDASDYAYVLEGGRVALHGPAAEMASNQLVMATYLGRVPESRMQS